MRRVPLVISTWTRVRLCVAVLFVATAIDVAWSYGHFPDHSGTARFLWGLVAVWLLAPALTMARIARAAGGRPQGEALVTAFQVGLLGYVPIALGMQLIRLVLRQ